MMVSDNKKASRKGPGSVSLSSTTDSSKISTHKLQLYIEELKNNTVQPSTRANYHQIWTNFNEFVIQLDHIPAAWEDKTSLYCAYLIKNGYKSSTVKSYVSAIKHKLTADDYKWDDQLVLLSTLTKACKLTNDKVITRLPICQKFLEVLIFELIRFEKLNEYDRQLYKTIFLTLYYGLMRIGEVARSQHSVRAMDVHIAQNKEEVMMKLFSSKTHSTKDRPQTIIIDESMISHSTLFNPVEELTIYSNMRPEYRYDEEEFFVFANNTPITASQIRSILRKLIRKIGLCDTLYDTHSFRIGGATDLFRLGVSVEKIKKKGRWKSNAVYKYLR